MNAWETAGVCMAVWLLLVVVVRSADLRDQLRRLERRLDALLAHQGLQNAWSPQPSERVREHIASGRKIEAIRVYRRENPQIGLKEAKDTVEDMAARGRSTPA